MSGGRDNQSAQDDLKAFGLLVELEANEDFEVYAENEQALDVFIAASTQWKFSPVGQPIGLDYQGLQAILGLYEIENKKQVFMDIQTMERAVLKELNRG